jgi:hypothetical protein
MSKCDANSDSDRKYSAISNTIVCANYLALEQSGDHDRELGFVQQRDGAHGQQLLESV